jgi:hypothetical protein
MCQEIQFFLPHKLVPENNFLDFVTHILCTIKIYWHLVYVPKKNFLDAWIADIYLMLVINTKMNFLGI